MLTRFGNAAAKDEQRKLINGIVRQRAEVASVEASHIFVIVGKLGTADRSVTITDRSSIRRYSGTTPTTRAVSRHARQQIWTLHQRLFPFSFLRFLFEGVHRTLTRTAPTPHKQESAGAVHSANVNA